MRRNRKAQSTLEYVIVLAAIIAAVIIFATGTFTTKINSSLEHVANEMQNVVQRIDY